MKKYLGYIPEFKVYYLQIALTVWCAFDAGRFLAMGKPEIGYWNLILATVNAFIVGYFYRTEEKLKTTWRRISHEQHDVLEDVFARINGGNVADK